MRISGKWTITAAMLTCSLAILCSTPAPAATVTYNFSEAGWLNSFGTTENLSGSFTGMPEANGDLALADLTSFVATMTETNATGATKNVATFGSATGTAGLADFLYMPGSNSLTLEATGSPTAMVCLGNDVGTGFCGPLVARPQPKPGTSPLLPIEGLFSFSVNGALNAYSTDLPSVLQTVGLQPVPAPSTVPEPAPVILCGATLVLATRLRRGSRETRGGQ